MSPRGVFALLIAGTVVGIAGIDLVLPAVPTLPAALGSTPAEAQLVLASHVAGTGIGLVFFAWLGDRFRRGSLLIASFTALAVTSFACALAPSMPWLIVLRFAQGAAGSAAAVFAPGVIRALFAPAQAVRAIGFMGSVEALAPALAPIAGAALLAWRGWQTPFYVSGALAVVLLVVSWLVRDSLPGPSELRAGSYAVLLRDRDYLRYALSQVCTLGGLLTFVFGAPAVFVGVWSAPLESFIAMQVIGVAAFIVAANSAQRAVARWGDDRMILFGSALAAASGIALTLYGALGGREPGSSSS